MIPAVTALGAKLGLPYQWVMAGASGNLYTSTDTAATTWTSRTSSFSTTAINGVASNGLNLYVAVGASGKLATSPDGVTWTQRTSGFGTTAINGVGYGNNLWVAVGASGTLTTSADGTTWTSRTSSFSTTNIAAVTYGNGYWLAVGSSGKIATSTDGTTWTQRTSSLGVGDTLTGCTFSPTTNLFTISYGTSAGFTAVATASDPTSTWTARIVGAGTWTASLGGLTNNSTATCGPGYSGGVGYSTNGTTWSLATISGTPTFYAIATDDAAIGQFVMMRNDTANSRMNRFLSTDGSTWASVNVTGFNFNAFALCHSSGVPSIR